MTAGPPDDAVSARLAFAAPVELAAHGIALRLQAVDDVPFLRRLYVSLRWEEVQRIPHWDDVGRRAFLEDQHARQHHHYSTHYTRSDFLIIEQDGVPVGRLALDRGHPTDLRVVDIALLPEARGQGLGAAFLEAVKAEARCVGKRVSIHVEEANPAKRLYARLGFRDVSQNGPYWLMAWTASDDVS